MHIAGCNMSSVEFFSANPIVPVVVLNNIDDTIPTLEALSDGGIKVAEITFRTACAKDAILLASKHFDDMLIGAGTVINKAQCLDAIEAGAQFIVSPGLSEGVAEVCKSHGIPYLAGVATPTEIIAAKDLGLDVVKFFPAEANGGVKALSAIAQAFPGTYFVPTGGINRNNAKDYYARKEVLAIGGSWMLKGSIEDIANESKNALALLEEIDK